MTKAEQRFAWSGRATPFAACFSPIQMPPRSIVGAVSRRVAAQCRRSRRSQIDFSATKIIVARNLKPDATIVPKQRCLWSETAVAPLALASLSGPCDTEVAIIGAGLAGLSVALALAERGVAAVVLEAGEIGEGASGRNGGQVIGGLRHLPDELVEAYGRERGVRLHEFGLGTADAAFALIRRLGLDCDAAQDGWINTADTPAGMEQAARRVASWQKHGVAARLLDRAELQDLTGTQAYLGGWLLPGSGCVQPLSLVRELARAAADAGAQVHIRSRAHAILRDGQGWRIATAAGSLGAKCVLIATNALTGALSPAVAQSTLPVWSFQIATEPLPASSGIMRTGAGISDNRRILRYFRRDAAGRLVVGGKGTAVAPNGIGSFGLQRETMARLYPQLREVAPAYYWGGQVAVTIDRLPRIFTVDDGVLATLGCNGKGIAWNLALGPVLADALTGAPLDALPLPPATPPRPIPFHSLRRVYAGVGATWLRLRDRFDHGAGVAG
jgi:glycine/D-amino acid oxidase-like deaminating enzyme